MNIALAGIAVFFAYEAFMVIRQAAMARQKLEEHDKKISALQEEKARLEAAIANLKTSEGIEREAKKRLNLKNPGEEVVVVVPDQKSSEEPDASVSWRQRLMDWLRKLY